MGLRSTRRGNGWFAPIILHLLPTPFSPRVIFLGDCGTFTYPLLPTLFSLPPLPAPLAYNHRVYLMGCNERVATTAKPFACQMNHNHAKMNLGAKK